MIRVIIHLSKPIECTTARVSPNVSSGVWVTHQCTTLVGDTDIGERLCRCRGGAIWEISRPYFNSVMSLKLLSKKINSIEKNLFSSWHTKSCGQRQFWLPTIIQQTTPKISGSVGLFPCCLCLSSLVWLSSAGEVAWLQPSKMTQSHV